MRALKVNITIPIFIFLVPLIFYIKTINPNFILYSSGRTSDAVDFILGVNYLGIIHPPGHLPYILLGKAAIAFIPFGSVGFRLSCLSALCASLAALFVYAILLRRTKSIIIAAASALALAFSKTFWSQAVIQEVYTLHALLGILIIFFIFLWKDTKKWIFLPAAFFSFGLSFTNHPTIVLILPGLLYFLWEEKALSPSNLKKALILVGSFLLGLFPYLYFPLRIQSTSYINPMIAQLGTPIGSFNWYILYFSAHDLWGGSTGEFFLSQIPVKVSSYFKELIGNFTFIGAVFVIVGIGIWRGRDAFSKCCIITFFLSACYFMMHPNIFLFSFVIGSLLLGEGAMLILKNRVIKRAAPLVFFIPIFLAASNYNAMLQINRNNRDYLNVKASLEEFDKDAIFISWYTFSILPYKYYQMMEGLRSDISFYSIEGAPPDHVIPPQMRPQIEAALRDAKTRRDMFDMQVSAWANIIKGWIDDPNFKRPIFFIPPKDGVPAWLSELWRVEPIKNAAGAETGIFRLRRK